MLTAGIIAEYNPFHSGHAFLSNQLRSMGATHIVSVISGNYVQRGNAAVLSKWARTEQALSCGSDLVVELPLPWALAGAERFAIGGIFILNELGADTVGFGSECGSIEKLKQASAAITSPLLREAMTKELSRGMTFASARQKAVESLFGAKTALLLKSPNNILGIEYLKALNLLHSPITPRTFQRIGTSHDAPQVKNGYASSSRIRSLLYDGEDCSGLMPDSAWKVLAREIKLGRAPAGLFFMERAILAKLRSMSRSDLSALPDISEGLENRIFNAVQKAVSMEELYALIKTKRYTLARIRRIILSAFLGLKATDCSGFPLYIRVLGMRPNGAQILRAAKAKSKLPLITRASDMSCMDAKGKKLYQLETTADDLYALCQPKASPCGKNQSTGIFIFRPERMC